VGILPYLDVMQVIAQDHEWFVLQIDPDVGRVFDMPRGRLFAPMSLTAILERGTWQDFVGDPSRVIDALTRAEDVSTDQMSLTGGHITAPDREILLGAWHERGSEGVAMGGFGSTSRLANATEALRHFGAAVGERVHRARSSS
jgi:hypothetical protein